MVSGHFGTDLGAAAKLGELAATHAAASEAGRRLTPEVAMAIADAGFVRHFVPARWGGAEGGFLDYLRAIELVGEGDPSAAWVAAISASLGRMACYLPPAAQADLWADGPDAFLACALVPGGTATAVPGGWLVSGVWRYLSGVHFSAWALVACPVPRPGCAPEVRFLLVPRDAYTIEDSWYSVGMRATGSDSLRLREVFVPEGRGFSRAALVAGRAPDGAPAAASAPIKVMSGLSFAGPILGAARAGLRELAGQVAARRERSGTQHRVHDSGEVSVELALARGAGELDAAWLLLEDAARDADRGAFTEARSARAALRYALAADMATTVVNALIRVAGTSGGDERAPLQRFWRDVTIATSHRVLGFEDAARQYAAVLLDDAS